MKRYIIFLVLLSLTSFRAKAWEHSPYAADTLQRELTLQKEYVPVGHQAQKATFNPLDTRGKASLTPIEFAKNTYQVGMNVTPKLFNPIQNPMAPEYSSQQFHARFFGGYPIFAGANIGFANKIGHSGSLLIGIDHLSRNVKFPKSTTPFSPQCITHDTEARVNYTHALDDRLLDIGVEGFHHLNSFYGFSKNQISTGLNNLLNGDEVFQEHYKLYQLAGGAISLSISPAPLSLLAGWQYSASGKLGLAQKSDPVFMDDVHPILSYESKPNRLDSGFTMRELDLNLSGNLGYNFAGTDWGFGVDGAFRFLTLSKLLQSEGMKPAYLLSLDPFLQYNSPSFLIKAGAKFQLLNRGEKSFLITPDVEFRWKAAPSFSLYAVVDGGAEYMGLKELYGQNRYAESGSVYTGYNITKYRALVGLQLGNYNGFAINVYGGYADFSSFSDWTFRSSPAPLHPSIAHDPFHFVTFKRENRGAVGQIFISTLARYVSNFGLDLSGALKYNKYTRKPVNGESATPIEGLPSIELNLTADYAFTNKLSAGITFGGLSGIRFMENVNGSSQEVKTPFIHELDARISYKVHKNIGLSIIGKNITNNQTPRWAFYDRPGATIIGAITINL